jgi:hypothetical protein
MEPQLSEKPTWRERTRARIRETHQKGWFIVVGVSFVFLALIALMIALPLKLVGQVPTPSDTDPNVRNNNNFLPGSCPYYTVIAKGANAQFSDGPLHLPFQRPTNSCRTFTSDVMEKLITNVTARMVDPDLARIFENSYPNTLGTAFVPSGAADWTRYDYFMVRSCRAESSGVRDHGGYWERMVA